MKKSKSLVITSLLFSTMILNPSMINAVVVNAATNSAPAGTTAPTPIPTDTTQGTPDKKTTTITVKFLDSTDNRKKFDTKTIEVPNGAKEVKGSTITAPNGYIVTGRELITIQNNEILVHIKPEDSNTGHEVSKSDVIVKYINDGKENVKIPDGVIKDLEDNATSVDKSRVPVPSGYKLVENQNFKVSYGMVKVHVVPVIDKTTTTITITFLDSTDNLKKFDKKTIEVPNGTKKVKGSTITAPNGYIVTGRELIKIKNNAILVHIKPKDFNIGHEVSKSDVIVKYINDGKENVKIPDGVIKDLEDNATSVDKSRVPVPSGYKLVENQNFKVSYGMVKVHVVPVIDKSPTGKPSKPNKKPGHSSSTDATTYTNKVQFIDQATNKEIGSMKVSGLNGSKHKLVIPEGYELAKNETSEVKIDKSQKAYHVTVIKKNVTVVKPGITSHKTTFATNKTTQLFTIEGKAVRNRALMANTSWAVDKQMTLNGTTYFRVATNEWVKVSDGSEITITESAAVNRTVRTSGNSAKRLYTSTGQLVGNRALAANTPWFSDKSAVINGQKMYRVATNEWVSANDLA